MYRTATLQVYDVLDEVFVNAVIMEYPDMPGTCEPIRTVYCTKAIGKGQPDESVWLWEALQAMQVYLDQR